LIYTDYPDSFRKLYLILFILSIKPEVRKFHPLNEK